jgi:NADH:ubiquinone oxidoreductase subunit C
MEKQEIREKIEGLAIEAEFNDTRQYLEILVSAEKLHEVALKLKNSSDLKFDFLLDATAVDWNTHFTVVYHLTSSELHHVLVLKTNVSDRETAEIETVSDIWITAEFQEREIFDLFGIKFKNHKDMRRIFLDDDWGFPLRKDYTDENTKELK